MEQKELKDLPKVAGAPAPQPKYEIHFFKSAAGAVMMTIYAAGKPRFPVYYAEVINPLPCAQELAEAMK